MIPQVVRVGAVIQRHCLGTLLAQIGKGGINVLSPSQRGLF